MTTSCTSILIIAEPKFAKGENVPEWATIRIMELEPGRESESETNTDADDGPEDSVLPETGKGKKARSTRARRAATRSVSKRGGVTAVPRSKGKSSAAPRRPATAETALNKSARSTSSEISRRKHAYHWQHSSGSKKRCRCILCVGISHEVITGLLAAWLKFYSFLFF